MNNQHHLCLGDAVKLPININTIPIINKANARMLTINMNSINTHTSFHPDCRSGIISITPNIRQIIPII